jgi:hypothetical protein
MTKKYNFYDYKLPSKKDIPDDLNALPMEVALKLDPSGEFKKFMKHWQDRKKFGPLNFICPKTMRLVAVFEFQSGMCKHFDLIEYMGETSTHGRGKVLNDKVSFQRNDSNE